VPNAEQKYRRRPVTIAVFNILGVIDSIHRMVIVAVTVRGDIQLNTSETSKIRTCSVSAKLEDPDELKKGLRKLANS